MSPKNNKFSLNGKNLTTATIKEIASSKFPQLEISAEALELMKKSRQLVLDIIKQGRPVYGINTGFGALSSKHIEEKDLAQLQLNLIRSHCTGVGRHFSREITRAIMLLRANCLCQGLSGVNPEIVQLLIEFLNHDILPLIPEKGSVGASGDLAPLSHLALALIGEGEVSYQGQTMPSLKAIKAIGKRPAVLGPKDGLALINGTAVMAALGSIAIEEAKNLVKSADIISMLTLDAVRGTSSAFHSLISEAKPHRGQREVAQNLRHILKDSKVLTSHPDCGKVQDPYSLRCIPQVHGSVRQTLYHAEEIFSVEINSVTDNPLVFADTKEVVSGGNFHGEALALAMDYLAMGMAELCNISERRVEKMMNPHFSDLPAFLTKNSGLNSGLMIAHVTMASLVSENKVLGHPASIDSIPTSTDKEDHVSMGVTSGRKLLEIIENTYHCLAIELLCSSQGLDLLRPLQSSPALEALMKLVRAKVDFIENDRVFSKDIYQLTEILRAGSVVSVVENLIGNLH